MFRSFALLSSCPSVLSSTAASHPRKMIQNVLLSEAKREHRLARSHEEQLRRGEVTKPSLDDEID